MEVKPTKGLRVRVSATREAVFGDESVSVSKVVITEKSSVGTMTGMTLAGFCEVEMDALDGKKHWYPIDELRGEGGEVVKEDEIQLDADEDEGEDEDE
ncbi:MAG TPA: hypothetical protein VEJ36_06970 [Nitrososphaerales archaeon]|nr:hypothetical protein [Nitrososphaerales archaeon]